MDTLTHALSGALAARAAASGSVAPRSIPRRVAAGFLACAAPDLDVVAGWIGPAEFLLHHRGVTHSIVMLPLWAFVLAWLLARILREPLGWRALYGVCALALAMHIAGDLITSYGTVVLAPLSDWRAVLGTTFIIDLWFTGIILAGLAASAFFFRSRVPAIAALALLCGYVGFQYVLKEQAIEFGREYAGVHGLRGAVVSAHPRPVSPFNWTVFVSDESAHRYAHVNLVRRDMKHFQPGDGFVAKLDAAYAPLAQARWEERSRYGATQDDRFAREAWGTSELDVFRWFAALPALESVTLDPACAWFVDLRFHNPGREYLPFRFGACRDARGASWRAYEFDRGVKIPLR